MIPEDKWFYFAGGKKAASIEELRNVLHHISDPEFVFHLNSGKNDFANWVEGVFQEKDLADDMRKVLEKKDLIELLSRFLHPEKEKAHLGMRTKHTESQPKPGVHKELPTFELEIGGPGEKLELESPKETAEEKKPVDLVIPETTSFFNHENEPLLPPIPLKNVQHPRKEAVEQKTEDEPKTSSSELEEGEEHPLSADEVKGIVLETRQGLKTEDDKWARAEEQVFGTKQETKAGPEELEAGLEKDGEDEDELPLPIKEDIEKKIPHVPKFIVKEFIYGFILGLIFGLIMLGFLVNLKAC